MDLRLVVIMLFISPIVCIVCMGICIYGLYKITRKGQ